MYKLSSTRPGGGLVTEHGEWPTLKMATLVARAVQEADPDTPRSFSARPSDRNVSITVPLTPPTYHELEPVEVAFSDGRIAWSDELELVDSESEPEAKPQPACGGDVVYVIAVENSEVRLMDDTGRVLHTGTWLQNDGSNGLIDVTCRMLKDLRDV